MGQLFNTNRNLRNNIMQNQYQLEFINFRYSVSVLTYNILAQVYCEKSHFSYAQDHNLNFQNRALKILEQLKNFNSDIVCLQEVDNFEYYQAQLRKLNYQICFVQRPQRVDGCLIAFKCDKFKLMECSEYSLDKMAINYGLTIQYQRQNVFLIVKLEHIITKKQIVIGNIHTFWNPNQEDLKYFQIVQLVQKMELEKESDDQMLIFCGDFNSLPQSNQIQYILKNKPIVERIEKSSSQIKMLKQIYDDFGPPKYQWQSAFNPFPKYTNYTKDFKGCIDYIFYHKASIEKILRMPNENLLKEETALPNYNFPSDHLPLLVYFDFHE